MVKKSISINLKQGPKTNNLDKFIDWALTTGRILVIVTELIALAAFLYRFSLDQQLSDLNSTIRREEGTVISYKKDEDKYRNLQDRLSLASVTMEKSSQRETIYNDLVGLAPEGLTFDSVDLLHDKVTIIAVVPSISPLSTFVDSLKKYSAFDNVSIDKVENKVASSLISVTITANLKPNFKVNETAN